jgi:hypothetical protein
LNPGVEHLPVCDAHIENPEEPTMNVLLWIVQAVLALEEIAGGAYKIFNYNEMVPAAAVAALSRGAWAGVGAFEIVFGLLLIIPAATKRKPNLTPLAAVGLMLESLALAGVYARYSTALVAANPLVYVLIAAVLAAFVAYGRYSLRPLRARTTTPA